VGGSYEQCGVKVDDDEMVYVPNICMEIPWKAIHFGWYSPFVKYRGTNKCTVIHNTFIYCYVFSTETTFYRHV
jgi:hypothetical protein